MHCKWFTVIYLCGT